MQKIISFSSKDFLSGISEYPNTSNYGFWSQSFMNPYSRIGTIQPSQTVSDLTNSTWVVDKVQSFVQDDDDLYGLGENENFYKITNIISGGGTVTNLRAGSLIANTSIGFETFQTKVGATPKLYYWRGGTTGTGYVGEYNIASNLFNDTLCTISPLYPSANHPILRVDDVIFFGSGYVLSKIYDDNTNADPAILDNILDLPTDHKIVSLETDGTYLIITAQVTSSNDTKIYFWDYKNKLDSWTLEYTIRDTVGQLKNIKGVIYAIGKNGLYAFNSTTEPIKIRGDVKNSSYQGMVRYNDGLLISTSNSVIKSYGTILPNVKSGVFSLCIVPANTNGISSMIIPSYLGINNIYVSIIDGISYRIKSFNILGTQTSSNYQSLNLTSSVVDLGQDFIIKRADITFAEPLASGQAVNSVVVRAGTGGSTADTLTFTDPSFTDYGAVRKCELYPQASEITVNNFQLSITDNGGGLGTNSIRQIDIYGEPSIK
jgi:hypothetical protein